MCLRPSDPGVLVCHPPSLTTQAQSQEKQKGGFFPLQPSPQPRQLECEKAPWLLVALDLQLMGAEFPTPFLC